MPIDVQRARDDTPGCGHVLHFNNAGAALMPRQVVDAVIDHLNLEARIGGYEASERAQEAVKNSYRAAAELINCDPHEIAMVENATRAWDMAFYSIKFGPGDRILTSVSEYASNFIAFLHVSRRTGATVEVIPNDEYGRISTSELRRAVDDRVKLIAVTHVPTNGGLINPAEEVGHIAREAGILYLLDACQSVGQMPLDVRRIGCHLLSATGRKFLRGPRGTGFLYVSADIPELLEPVFLDLHAARWVSRDRYEIRTDARRFENWETNYSTRIGLGVAIDYALGWGLPEIRERIVRLAEHLRMGLEEIPGVTVRDLGVERCGIVSFTLTGRSPEWVKKELTFRSINVSVSPSQYTLLDMQGRELDAVIRASVHYYNTEEEVWRFCTILRSLVNS